MLVYMFLYVFSEGNGLALRRYVFQSATPATVWGYSTWLPSYLPHIVCASILYRLDLYLFFEVRTQPRNTTRFDSPYMRT